MDTVTTHALIVGIDRYESPNLAPLQGARNDAVAWFRFCVRHLGVDPKNITVLANPPLSVRELGPEAEQSKLGAATRADIVASAQRLAEAAATSSGSGDEAGFVTFSGHGLAVPPVRGGTSVDLALCPSDVRVSDALGADVDVGGALRFSELAEIFRSQDSRDNITVFLDACYSNGPNGAMRGPAPLSGTGIESTPQSTARDALGPQGAQFASNGARHVYKVESFTNRLILGARHWTAAYEIKAQGQWRGAASFALQTVLERWALKADNGAVYPNVSHADLVTRMRDFLSVLGVDQTPALWSQRRLDEMPFLRPGLRFTPGETSPVPNAQINARQLPVDPDKVGLLEFRNSSNQAIIRVVVTAENVPGGIRGVSAQKEYWYTNTTSPPSLAGLTPNFTTTTVQATLDNFISGYTRCIECDRVIGQENWQEWTSENTAGTLLKAADPSGADNFMGLYLEYQSNGLLATYCWYRITLLDEGMAYRLNELPGQFTVVSGTNPNTIESGTWLYSLVV